MSVVLAELRDLRREHSEASKDRKATLSRVESTLEDMLQRTTRLEQQVTNVEQRMSDTEDKALDMKEPFAIYFKKKLNCLLSVKTSNPVQGRII